MEAKPPGGLLVAAATIVVLSVLTYAIVSGAALNATVAGVEGLIRFMVQDKPESEKIGSSRREAEKADARWRVAIPPVEEPAAMVAVAMTVEPAALRVVPNRPNDRVSPARRDQIRAAQSALLRLGFYNGQIDGSMGKGTISAIRAYEKSLGWPVTGQLTPKVAARLTPQTAEGPQN